MRKLFFLIAIATCFTSCKETKNNKDYVIISGKVMNSSSTQIELTWNDIFKVNPNPKISIELSETGDFLDTLKVMSGYYSLMEGKNRTSLHLANGMEVNVSYDAKDLQNTLQFSGEGAEIGTYLAAKDKLVASFFGPNSGTNFYNVEEADFKNKVDGIKNDLEILLANTQNITDDVRAREKREINYTYIDFIRRYTQVYAYISKNPDYKASAEFTRDLDALTYDREEDFMFSRTYQYMVLDYFRDIANEIAKEKGTSPSMELLKSLSTIPNETIKGIMVMFYGKSDLARAEDLDAMYNLVMNNTTNTLEKKNFTELYNDLKTLAKGQPSPTFENYENYKGGTTSLSDFKGKYVFIDVWATWCGPCRAQIPFLEKIEKEYHGKNIAFVSMSVDNVSAKDAWKKMIKKDNMGGVQLFADHAFKSKFIQDYKISSIPRFILVDPDGNIVSINAPRPSDKELRSLLNSLIK